MTLSLFDIWGGDHVVGLHGGGSAPTGVSDWRFSSSHISTLQPEWPFLSHDRPMKPTLSTGERLTPDLVERLDDDIPIETRNDEDGADDDVVRLPPSFPERMPDIFNVSEVYFVSRRVKDIVESLEPQRHQYFPVKFHAKDTGERMYEEQGFHYWNVLNWVPPDLLYDFDAMDGKVEVKIVTPPPRPNYIETFREFAAFKTPPQIKIISIRSWMFKTWRIRPEWYGVGHAMRTGSYFASRLSHVHADNKMLISEELCLALKSALPPESFKAVAIPFSV